MLAFKWHAWTPAEVPTELLADVNEGMLLQLAPELRGGKLSLGLIQVGDTYGERWREDKAAAVTAAQP